MADEKSPAKPGRFRLHDVPGTTVAVASLAIFGAAALVTAPIWLWYRRKRKRADALARDAGEPAANAGRTGDGHFAPPGETNG